MKVKKKVSKKLKSSWRKHVDISDVEAFLDDKRLEERLGVPFEKRGDDDLFQIDTKPSSTVVKSRFLTKKEKARSLPLKCFSALDNSSAVPDPFVKRNTVRTKEERQHPALKAKNENRRKKGIFKKKDIKELSKYLQRRVSRLKEKPKRKVAMDKDLWNDDSENQTKLSRLRNWMNESTVLHTVRNVSCFKKASSYRPEKTATVIPSFEAPHPGASYNPSFKDHLSLVNEVAEKEVELQRKEAHLNRVTQGLFKHITAEQNEKNWMAEMLEGLPFAEKAEQKEQQEDDESDGEYKAINPPVTREKKKTIKQRKKELRLKQEELKRNEAKEQKKKALDICKVTRIMDDVLKDEKNKEKKELKKVKKIAEKYKKVRRVGRNKFADGERQFADVGELTGSLREIIPAGNILKDKFLNMQKRNLIEVVKPQFKRKKRKVKRYQLPSHRLEPTEFSAADVIKNVHRKKK